MNLGIVIAVSNYGSLGNNLPGCKIDGQAIAKILQTDNKFDDVLVITDKTESGVVKPELINFINRHKDSEINDIVFYFTGHGDFSGNEFYYLLGDYDKKRKKQTSLENTELDNLLKTLNPQNAIKIVDACHSGIPYIKDTEAFDKYLKDTQGEFKKCYFMFSSQTDQYSYQDENLSFFTKSIVESVYHHSSNIIRYKDIIDYVSDSFSDNTNQTPFFIVQADFTESFCTLSETLRNSLKETLDGSVEKINSDKSSNHEHKSLLDLVIADSKKYCSEEEGMNNLRNFLSSFQENNLKTEIKDLYEIKFIEEGEYSSIPSTTSIGKWLESNEHKFFASPYKEDVLITKRVPKNPRKQVLASASLSYFLGNNDDDDNYKYIEVTEKHIKGFRSTVDMPVVLLKIIAETKYPNINPASAYIVPIISRTELRVFYSFNFFEQQGWNERKISNSVKWSTAVIMLSDTNAHLELSKKIYNEFSQFLYNPIAEKFSLTNDTEDEKTET